MLSFSKVLRNVNKPLISTLTSIKPSSETKRFWTEDRVDTLKSVAVYTGTLGLTGLECYVYGSGMQDYLSLSTFTLSAVSIYRGKFVEWTIEDSETPKNCGICSQEIISVNKGVKLLCNHYFHKSCLGEVFFPKVKNTKCPTCKLHIY